MAAAMPVGVERMAQMPVAERANFSVFQRLAQGTAVRVGGRFAAAADEPSRRVLTTTDGGTLTLSGDDTLPQTDSFVEVVGTKAGDNVLAASGAVPFPGDEADVELWDEAVKMSHMPQVRALFAPRVVA
mmetsp:Transcript_46997/g.105651  ORF Transcript_46997/g.105651 Transcript_46997/m.105651 type:complete len:129 (+) Transcript_46997:72-458(+)